MKHNYESKLLSLFETDDFPKDAFFLDQIFNDQEIVVYGAGESFHYFKETVINQYGYMPSVILDNKFNVGDNFENIPAYPPSQYRPKREQQNAIVVICLGKQQFYDDIVSLIKSMGYKNIIHLLDIYEIHNPFSLPPKLQLEGFDYYLSQKEAIINGFHLLSDELSKEVYLKCLQTHMLRKPVPIPMNAREEQYYPKDIKLNKGYKRIIYCGVSVGEIKSFLVQIGETEEIVCFEPDPNQFKLIAKFFSENHNKLTNNVKVIPCAVFSNEKIHPFTYSKTSFGSRILSNGNARIQSVTIDNILPGFDPSFINMDIEGAELEALKGAKYTIIKSCPDLAICVYHSPNHLWEIIHYLNNLQLKYKFFLRNYTSFIGETVLYATSPNH